MTHRIEDVVARGMCVGCGACAVRTAGAIPVTIGRYGVFQARLEGVDAEAIRDASRVCPFSDESVNEDALTQERFAGMPTDDKLGAHLEVLAGRRTSEDEVVLSSSGGLTSFVLAELLSSGTVDAVIHVGRATGEQHFDYAISTTVDELESSRKSMYTATTFAEVVTAIRGDGLSYAVVGLPCFITALRHLAREMPELGTQIAVYVGLVCGHLKSTFFAESLAWQGGIAPADLESIDFRVKQPGRPASDYDYAAVSRRDHASRVRRTRDAFDTPWGYGAFQPEACNFCDDVFAESADVAFADAWLPQYQDDWRGTNVVVVRDERVQALLRAAAERGEIELAPLSAEDAARSQAGNFRHRRTGLAVRLADDLKRGLSVPLKRVDPDRTLVTRRRAAVIRQRRRMSRLSLERFARARAADDFEVYAAPMRRAIGRYDLLDAAARGPKPLLRFLKRRVSALLTRTRRQRRKPTATGG